MYIPVLASNLYQNEGFCLISSRLQPMVMHLACVLMKMDMNEALAAATINAAASLGKSQSHGSLEVGKVGDVLVLNAPR